MISCGSMLDTVNETVITSEIIKSSFSTQLMMIYRPAFSLWKVPAWHHHHHWLYWRHPHNSWWSWRVWRWWRRWWTLSALPGPVWSGDKCRLHNLHKSSWINISSLFDTLIIHRVDATISTVLRRSSIRIIKVTRPASSRMTGAKEDSGDLLRHILDVDPWLRLRLLVTHDPLSPVTRWPLTPLHCMQISSLWWLSAGSYKSR